jgi:hypothetical protein
MAGGYSRLRIGWGRPWVFRRSPAGASSRLRRQGQTNAAFLVRQDCFIIVHVPGCLVAFAGPPRAGRAILGRPRRRQ